MKFISKMLVFMLILLVLMASAFAQDLSAQVDAMAKEVKGQKLAGPVGVLLGDQRINIEIGLNNGEKLVIGLITEDKEIIALQNGTVDDPTLIVYTDEKTVQQVQSAEDPGKALSKAILGEKIKYKVKGFFNKIKFKFVSVILKMANPGKEKAEENIAPAESEEGPEVVETVPAEEPIETAPAVDVVAEEPTRTEDSGLETNTTLETELTGSEEEAVESSEAEEQTEDVSGNNLYTVVMDNTGFATAKLNIKVGDTVTWKNSRSGQLTGAMIIGARFNCNQAKSGIFKPGESYSYTFDKSGACVVVDGIFTTAVMNVIVEE